MKIFSLHERGLKVLHQSGRIFGAVHFALAKLKRCSTKAQLYPYHALLYIMVFPWMILCTGFVPNLPF